MIVKANQNKEEKFNILKAIRENSGYCPCALCKNEDTKCMCKDFREAKAGTWCHCGLYYKVEE